MAERMRLVRYYLVSIVVAIVILTLAYDLGMSLFDGRPRTLLESFEFVMQTLTTTGYGQDAPWQSPVMTVLVITIQIASLVLIFAAFPILIVPWVEDALKTTPPTERTDLSDHVVICAHSNRTETLVDELETRDVQYVVVEPDRDLAQDLFRRDWSVVHGSPDAANSLRGVNVADARAVVADADDTIDLSIIMTSKTVAPEVPVYSVVEDPSLAKHHEHAGVDRVFSPRVLLGRGLANKVRHAVSTDLDAVDLGSNFEFVEMPIQPGSSLRGKRVEDTTLGEPSGVRLIGAWSSGEFVTPPFPDLRLDEHTVLLVAGRESSLRRLKRQTLSEIRPYGRGEVIIAGFGVVGSTVSDTLAGEDVPRTVVDVADQPGVDVVGDVTDASTLREAGVDEARTVVLALNDDTTTLLASFVVREVNPDAEIVARVEETESVTKLYRAGTDYVLALATVTGRLLASTILDEGEVLTVDRQVEVVRHPAAALAGQTLGEASVAERTGCTVVAVERRDGRIVTDLNDWTEIRASDHVVVAGLNRDISRYSETFLDE
jgi:Trk K+ transport system NAD-binding subunit